MAAEINETGDLQFETQYDYLAYSKNIQHGYSKAVGKLLDLVADYIQYAERQASAGKKAAYTNGVWDAPLFYGCDTIPVSNTELGRLGSRQAATVGENHFLCPREACSMVNAMLGEWYLRRDGPIKRVVSVIGGCEALTVAAELIQKEGYDVHFIDDVYMPKGINKEVWEEKIQYFTSELYDTAKFLLNGSEPDEAKINQEIRRSNRLINTVHRIINLRLKKPLYIKSLATMYLLTGLGHYYGRPDQFEEMVNELEYELSYDNPDFDNHNNIIPLVWSGGRGQEYGIYHAVDTSGGAILGWVAANNYKRLYREDIPPLESITRYLFENENSWNNAPEIKNKAIEDEVERVNAKGVLLYGYVGCTAVGIRKELMRSYLKDKGISSLTIDGTFQVGQPSGQLLTRVSAFMEMLT